MQTPWTCSACGATFGGLTGFDDHRTGQYLDRHPDYGRRCMSGTEMGAKGYRQDAAGLWRQPMDPETAAKLRAAKS